MLVRALHLVAKDDESVVTKLLSWSDLVLLDILRSHPRSAVLLCLLEKKKPFVPLAKVSMRLAQQMFHLAKSTSRSDLDKRSAIEREIAWELRIPVDDVILHYTARKSIYTRALQLSLPFENLDIYDEADLDNGTDLLMFNYMHMKYVVPGGGVHIFIKQN